MSGSRTLVRGEDFLGDDKLLANMAMASVRLGILFEGVVDILWGFGAAKRFGGDWGWLCSDGELECSGALGFGACMGFAGFTGLRGVRGE